MDFKDILAAEIAKKKQEIRLTADGRKGYVKRAELDARQAEEYLVEQKRLEALKQAKLQERLEKIEERLENSSRKRKLAEEPDQEFSLSREENEALEAELIAKGHPVRLFGESDVQRAERLKTLEIHVTKRETNDESVLQLKRAKTTTDPTTALSAMELDRVVPLELKKEPEKIRALIGLFLKRLLREWEADLEGRDPAEKDSPHGRKAANLQNQAREALRPFFRQLKRDQLAADILPKLAAIVAALQERTYLAANSAYLEIAIGNAPWPIGVTMVGIHERSAHERIAQGQVAHALNDEATRKWLQALKRLMTFCESKYPPQKQQSK